MFKQIILSIGRVDGARYGARYGARRVKGKQNQKLKPVGIQQFL